MNAAEEAREILAEADRLRKASESAENARQIIESGSKVKMHKGSFFTPAAYGYEDQEFSEEETQAIFNALAHVRDDYLARAEREENRVKTVDITYQDQ